MGDFTILLLGLVYNAFIIIIITRFLYSRGATKKEYSFSFFGVGIIVFLLCHLLSNVKLELGFALGLFAIFGILRYRTDTVPIREMTYLFVIIGLSVINALSPWVTGIPELIFTNLVVIAALWVLESVLIRKQELSVEVLYEKIQNVKVGKEDELLADLSERTGVKNISRYTINKIDFLRDVVSITVFFKPGQNGKK